MLKNVIVFAFPLMLLAISGCSKAPAAESVELKDLVMTVPAGTQLANIECGQPCILVWVPSSEEYVALLADGRTLTVTFDE